MAAAALFCYANRIVPAYCTLTSPQTFTAGLPLANLFNRRLGKGARFTNPSTTVQLTLNVDLGAVKRCRAFGLLNINRVRIDPALSSSATTYSIMTFKASNVALGGTDVAQGAYDLTDYGIEELEPNLIQPLPAAITARYWQFFFQWTRPTADAWGQAGVLWLSDGVELGGANAKGVDADWLLEHIDPSIVRRSRSQQVYTDERNRYRMLSLKSSLETRERMFGDHVSSFSNSIQGAFIRNGGSREVIVMPRIPSESWDAQNTLTGWDARQFIARTAVYGLLPGRSRIAHQKGQNFVADITPTSVR